MKKKTTKLKFLLKKQLNSTLKTCFLFWIICLRFTLLSFCLFAYSRFFSLFLMSNSKSKRKCTFSDNLQSKYPFLRRSTVSVNYVFCTVCNNEFSIGSGGNSHVISHINSERHKSRFKTVSNNEKLSVFLNAGKEKTDKAMKIALAEGTFAFHNIKHNFSFRSMDCTSNVMKKIHDESFSCARTKTEAIVENVIAKFAHEELVNELKESSFVSIYCDTSNHAHIKVVPILVRYYSLQNGICVKLLNVKDLPGETSDLIANYLISTLKNLNIESKTVAFCADNTNANFGGSLRKGTNNVYSKLQMDLKREIVGIGCAAHILNNALQMASDSMPVDIECILVKIFTHFHIYTVRIETLKDFCNYVAIEYHQVLGYAKTRWLSLLPAMKRLCEMFQPLKAYFLSYPKCPTILRSFFESESAELWLCFLQKQASVFHDAVTRAEGQTTTVVDVSNIVMEIINHYSNRSTDKFVPADVKKQISNLSAKDYIEEKIFAFYDNCVEYLQKWAKPFEDFVLFFWINLKDVPSWKEIEISFAIILKYGISIDENALYDEFTCLKKFWSEKIPLWNAKNVAVDVRWTEIFSYSKSHSLSYVNFLKVIEFILCVPGTNAPTERVFSMMNSFWTAEKNSLSISTLKAVLCVKTNLNCTCTEFYDKLSRNEPMLKAIMSSHKYKFYAKSL